MSSSFQAYHPFLTFSAAGHKFLLGNGDETGWGNAKPELNSNAMQLWRLGKEAFAALPPFKDKESFEAGYREHLEGIRILTKVLQEDASKFVFVNEDGAPWKPTFSDSESSELLNVFWQLRQFKTPILETFSHHLLFACLEEIDFALIGYCLDSDHLCHVLAAARTLTHFHQLRPDTSTLSVARSSLAIHAAKARYAKDPKQKELEFVYDCCEAWQAKPTAYKSKAAFARDMVDKCEHLASTKNIEDWCRQWGNKKV